MKKLLLIFAVLAALIIPTNQASAVIDLTTPVAIPNLTKWKITQITIFDAQSPPFVQVFVEIIGAGGIVYKTVRLSIYDSPNVSTVVSRALVTPTSYDGYTITSEAAIVGAYTDVLSAYDNAGGTRANKRKAAEVALIAKGIMVGLDGTNSIR